MIRGPLLCVLVGSVLSLSVPQVVDDNEEFSGDSEQEDHVTVSARLKKANKHLGKSLSGLEVKELDIAVGVGLQNADPCTATDCMWPKSKDGNVYVPYRLSQLYSAAQRTIIQNGLRSFGLKTCIRFVARTQQKDFLDIGSIDGCYSYVGRQGGGQEVSLDKDGCLYKSTVQHELMHALGFEHEHSRSDRDQHVRILWDNVESDAKENFDKVQTNNLMTPYDYDSVMQYERDFFSNNGEPTILPIPDNNVAMGLATEMSNNDVLRINRLYKCKKELEKVLDNGVIQE